jgi:hypothetical protein
MSERIRERSTKSFALESISSHDTIQQICLVNLTEPRLSSFQTRTDILKAYPLGKYAPTRWNDHYDKGSKSNPESGKLISKIYTDEGVFTNWRMLCMFNQKREPEPELELIATQLHDCSQFVLEWVLGHILNAGMRLGYSMKDILNDQGLAKFNALQAAASGGHYSTVQFLLDKGADVNIAGDNYGATLQTASRRGHLSVVQLLLDHNADVDAQTSQYGTALRASSAYGYYSVVQLLLDRGADVNINTQCGVYGTALLAASAKGHSSIVESLLDHHADVNAQGGIYGTALEAALEREHETVAQILRDAGAI